MNKEQAMSSLAQGKLVDCTKEEYETEIRDALSERAGKYLDWDDPLRAQIFLMEISRLDKIFGTMGKETNENT